ncbi:acyltransferase [Saliterribacillus persicus]|uniref:Surface polysaccharide O-acyltransferase-like enzyme n=1 Tax=Saliterribacillus persicus TaxID=930114 RepID=A0A368Y2I8_9BACI|nr:acyltransferase [Saliterribacillus persicus]RCW73037.1 surface polysaccharide O-acyltransferase-like enzyme [Saliterribacillus persicus]
MDIKKGHLLYEINILKALAFIAVVTQSAIVFALKASPVAMELSIMSYLYTFFKFSAPAFIFITGFLLFHHHYHRVSYRSFLTKKIADTYIPFIFWTLIYSALFIQLPSFSVNWLELIGSQLIIGSAANHLWYVVMVFQFSLLFPILVWSYKKIQAKMVASNNFRWMTIILIPASYLAILVGFNQFVFDGSYLTENFFLKYLDRSFLLYFIYFLLGGTAALYLSQWTAFIKKSMKILVPALLLVTIAVGCYIYFVQFPSGISLNEVTPLSPVMFILVLLQILVLYGVSLAITKKQGYLFRLLNFIGKYTFGSYLVHLIFLEWIAMIIEPGFINSALLASAIYLVLTVLFSVIFTFSIGSLPYCVMIIGPFEKVKLRNTMVAQMFTLVTAKIHK